METEFDKEIDTILRKAGASQMAANSALGIGSHLDADVIAAFAENAVPETARNVFTQHLAACDPCRQNLANAILFNAEAETDAASSRVMAIAVAVPWYKRILATPNLSYAMGLFVLLFSGLLGYIVLQRPADGGLNEVSQVSDKESAANSTLAAPSEPVPGSIASNSTANTSSVSGSPRPAAIANSMPVDGKDASPVVAGADADKATAVGGGVQADQPTVAAPAPKEVPKAEADEKKLGDIAARKDDVSVDGVMQEREDRQRSEENSLAKQRSKSPPAATSGPAKPGYGPRRDQNVWPNLGGRSNNEVYDSRSVGAKRFERRDNVWYDSAYAGQTTINIRRGTDDYRKLDAGLRAIAESFNGTVVTVWKSKAYRIQ